MSTLYNILKKHKPYENQKIDIQQKNLIKTKIKKLFRGKNINFSYVDTFFTDVNEIYRILRRSDTTFQTVVNVFDDCGLVEVVSRDTQRIISEYQTELAEANEKILNLDFFLYQKYQEIYNYDLEIDSDMELKNYILINLKKIFEIYFNYIIKEYVSKQKLYIRKIYSCLKKLKRNADFQNNYYFKLFNEQINQENLFFFNIFRENKNLNLEDFQNARTRFIDTSKKINYEYKFFEEKKSKPIISKFKIENSKSNKSFIIQTNNKNYIYPLN